MTGIALALAGVPLAVILAVVLVALLHRYEAQQQHRRQRLARTLAELHLQRLTHQAMADLLAEARRSFANIDSRP